MHASPHILVVAQGLRDAGRLDRLWDQAGEAPTVSALIAAADQIPAEATMFLGGGEPSMRPDMPVILREFGTRATLITDGLALHKPQNVAQLVDSGLKAVRIPCHAARPDAHDWLVGLPGAHRRVRQSFETLRSAQVTVSASVTLTRPTAPYLDETVAFLIRSGVSEIHFKMLDRLGSADRDYLSLAPRLALMAPALAAALRLASREGVVATVEGLPHCALDGFNDHHVAAPIWVCPKGIETPESLDRNPCHCPKSPSACVGLPKAYTKAFGWTETRSEYNDTPAPIMPKPRPQSGETVTAPPGRASRWPSTRVSAAVSQAAQENIGGDPMAGRAKIPPPQALAVTFPADDSTRAIKLRLVRLSQEGATALQILGPMDHPEAMSLIRECLRLSFDKVYLCGDITGLADASPSQLFHLRGLHALWAWKDTNNQAIAEKIVKASGVAHMGFTRISTASQAKAEIASQSEGPFVVEADIDGSWIDKVQATATSMALKAAFAHPQRELFAEPAPPKARMNWPEPSPNEVPSKP